MAKAIATRILEKTDPTSRAKAQEPQAMSNQQTPKPQSPHRKQPKRELVMVIPPGIGRHVIGRNGRVINDIKNKCMVEIETAKAGTGDEARVTITGRPDRVKDAENEINSVTNSICKKKRRTRRREARRPHAHTIWRVTAGMAMHTGRSTPNKNPEQDLDPPTTNNPTKQHQ